MTNEEAVERLRELSDDYWDDDGYGNMTCSYVDGITAIDMAIEALQERKTGKWKRVHNHVWECTTEGCGMRVSIRTPFCAYCGAKMEVDE